MSSLPHSKRCTKCSEDKPLNEYYKQRRSKDGLMAHCKACDNDRSRGYYQANKEQIKDRVRQYQEEDPDRKAAMDQRYYRNNRGRILVRVKKYYKANCQQVLEYHRRYRNDNRETIAAYHKKWYQENRERFDESVRQWQQANPELVAGYKRKWCENNPDKRRVYKNRRRAREAGAEGSHTAEQVRARVDYYGGLCYICGEPADTIDHVIALSNGGSNWPANLRPACKSCNFSKRDKDWRGFVNLPKEKQSCQ